jgi:3',5'-cyclic AMP phosphodiesterase CpdA
MRTIIHLSDLHFGRVNQALLSPLQQCVAALQPDVLVVSGDLTQRAKTIEFQAARAFLDTLPGPQIVVPGNHDIPLYNLARRFITPLRQYMRYVTLDLTPEYVDDEIAVLGMNTARSLTFKDGHINRQQIAQIHQRMSAVDAHLTRIVVTHHPFDMPQDHDHSDLVNRAPQAMQAFADCGVDLLLAGHLHVSHAHNTAQRYEISGYAALMVQAGTATSTRGRGETNTFNVLRVAHDQVQVERYCWDASQQAFLATQREQFQRRAGVWSEQH